MRFVVFLSALLFAQRSLQQDSCEVFVEAAFRCVIAESAEIPKPEKCCGKCNGTGKVLSGDGLALVDCGCPEDCPCKGRK